MKLVFFTIEVKLRFFISLDPNDNTLVQWEERPFACNLGTYQNGVVGNRCVFQECQLLANSGCVNDPLLVVDAVYRIFGVTTQRTCDETDTACILQAQNEATYSTLKIQKVEK